VQGDIKVYDTEEHQAIIGL